MTLPTKLSAGLRTATVRFRRLPPPPHLTFNIFLFLYVFLSPFGCDSSRVDKTLIRKPILPNLDFWSLFVGFNLLQTPFSYPPPPRDGLPH